MALPSFLSPTTWKKAVTEILSIFGQKPPWEHLSEAKDLVARDLIRKLINSKSIE